MSDSQVDVDQMLAELMQETLRLPHVDQCDNFLDLGGNSLAAMRIAARIYDVLGVTVPARTMLADASLRDLADALKSVLADGADTPRKHQQ
jgi:acyl carrier protein